MEISKPKPDKNKIQFRIDDVQQAQRDLNRDSGMGENYRKKLYESAGIALNNRTGFYSDHGQISEAEYDEMKNLVDSLED